jgi:hypothetical protein
LIDQLGHELLNEFALIPKVFPELTRYHYKYTKSTQRRQPFVLVEFTTIDGNNSKADWPLHVDGDVRENEKSLIEMTYDSGSR